MSMANFKTNDADLPVTKEVVKKRRRPTTAPRSRVQNTLGKELTNTNVTSRKQLNYSMYNSSDTKVKTYLKREMVSNKFLSINDYKAMTKQVQELQDLEKTYLDENLTRPIVRKQASNPSFITLNQLGLKRKVDIYKEE